MSGIIKVKKNNRCPVCGKSDWCGIAADGSKVFCMREPSNVVAKNGANVHFLEEDVQSSKFKVQSSKPKTVKVRRSGGELNEIYSAFLSQLVLAKSHKADLERRGLCETDIHLHGYKSNPASIERQICIDLKTHGFNLEGVPGFYQINSKWHFRNYNLKGFLIPIRNARLQIVALQLRTDGGQKWDGSAVPKYLMVSSEGKANGTSSGTPPHFAVAGLTKFPIESVIITEGALKANIIQKFTNRAVVGLVSINAFKDGFGENLREKFPNLKRVEIAFDIEKFDADNPNGCAFAHVSRQRVRLIQLLNSAGLNVRVLSWNADFKGMDDFLLNRNLLKKAVSDVR